MSSDTVSTVTKNGPSDELTREQRENLSTDGYVDLPPDEGMVDGPILAGPRPDAEPIHISEAGNDHEVVSITRIAHASVLIEFGDKVILTDPWFTETPEYHHGEPLAVGVDQLPDLTAVISSHAHYDHYDIEHFNRYRDLGVPLIVGFDDMVERARKAGFTDVRQLALYQTEVIDGVSITALPGAHGVPEITFLLTNGDTSVYFGGDTMLTPEVRDIASRGPVDIALLPVNGLRVGGDPVVASAEESAQFAGMLQAKVAIPIHYRFIGGPQYEEYVLTYNGTAHRFLHSLRRAAPNTIGRVLETGEKQAIV